MLLIFYLFICLVKIISFMYRGISIVKMLLNIVGITLNAHLLKNK